MEKTTIYKTATLSHKGYVRERNEDAFFVATNQRAFAVADGMGGMAVGDLASRMAVQCVEALWKLETPSLSEPDDVWSFVSGALGSANDEILKASFNSGLDMGTTLVVAVMADNGLLCYGHLGDSRLYTSRHGCLTIDHAVGPHELTRFAGCSLLSNPDLGSIVCQPGTRLLLCTDGLNKVVSDEEIMAAMLNVADPEPMLETLMCLALGYGGPDNVTMVCADYLED